jgi:signal peptidase II
MLWVVFTVALIGLDQWTKWYFLTNKDRFANFEVIENFFYLSYVENRGAAFGILQNFRWAFIVLTIMALIVMVWYFINNENNVLRLALAFIMAGALGNFIDRLFRGFVVDFLNFYPFGYDFPVFNVADICINIGAVLLIFYFLFLYREPKKHKEEAAHE